MSTQQDKYKTVLILPTPTEEFPDMVTLQTKSRYKRLNGKRYLNRTKAVIQIDLLSTETLIQGGAKKVAEELAELGLLPEE